MYPKPNPENNTAIYHDATASIYFVHADKTFVAKMQIIVWKLFN